MSKRLETEANIFVELVDQQQNFIVVNKPEDVNFHDEELPGQGFFSQVKQFSLEYLNVRTLFPVHRLDKMTSGLMIFATNLRSAQYFQQMFEQHQVEKYYLAIANGKPKKKQGLIQGDMKKSRRGMWKLLRSQNNPAINQFFSYNIAEKQRLYLIKPHSGKTHQIRVALSSNGVPILGDPLYNTDKAGDRAYLHAFALKFNMFEQQYQYMIAPSTGKEFQQKKAQEVIKTLSQPWLQLWPTLNLG